MTNSKYSKHMAGKGKQHSISINAGCKNAGLPELSPLSWICLEAQHALCAQHGGHNPLGRHVHKEKRPRSPHAIKSLFWSQKTASNQQGKDKK